ncbi:MAG: LD-carboxypeptidase [Actinomycetota bacterium]|nr:LD-carboxypeptidase [Actinomycetota bacterium]
MSPASTPDRDKVALGVELLTSWGLVAEVGEHAFDELGHYLAGSDEARLADLNDAFRDPEVRAVIATRGGKGSYRIADAIDFDAVRRDPKPLVGFSDITFLHQALYSHCRLATFHGPHAGWEDDYYGPLSAEALRLALMSDEPITLRQQRNAATAPLTTQGRATGTLLGGNLRSIGQSVGWGPSFDEAILTIEAVDMMPGEMDGILTQLLNSGVLNGVRGVAVGQFIRSAEAKPGKWSFLEILRDRLCRLGVPILGGLPIGHGPHPPTVPFGTLASLDTEAATLTVAAGVRA